MKKSFTIVSLNVSESKGGPKRPVGRLKLIEGYGAEGDAHGGPGDRQISLLAIEDIESVRSAGISLEPGEFAENITTRGIPLSSLTPGTRISIGDALLEVTQIGKKCHSGCAIMEKIGDCIMPKRGIFARVLEGGDITDESIGSYDI
jgi:MOSC domain-containing protein YiiM